MFIPNLPPWGILCAYKFVSGPRHTDKTWKDSPHSSPGLVRAATIDLDMFVRLAECGLETP